MDNDARLASIQKPSGATISIAYSGYSFNIASITKGGSTWNYAYTPAPGGHTSTTTATDPLGKLTTVVTNTDIGELSSVTDPLNRTTRYDYDSGYRLGLITRPEGDHTNYLYDSYGNLTQSILFNADNNAALSTSASYANTCNTLQTRSKPDTVTDGRGNVTSFTYDCTSGLVTSITQPATDQGVHPVTTYSYNTAALSYQGGPGTPIYFLTQTTACQTTSSCSGTADQVITNYSYSGSPNLELSAQAVRAGDYSVLAQTTMTYDLYGNLTQVSGPVAGQTSYFFYDAMHQKTGQIAPDPDGAGPRQPQATRTTYNADGLVSEVEHGVVPSQAATLGGFSSLQQVSSTFDGQDRKIQDWVTGGSVTLITNYSYDAADRPLCTAVRLNPSAYSQTSLVDACTLGPTGSDGFDRIGKNVYDDAGQLTSVLQGVGTASQRTYQSSTYNPDGEKATDVDANGNLTTYQYDTFIRLMKVIYPSPTAVDSSNASDFEQFGYDAASNMVSDRRRDGTTLTLSYDALNRVDQDINGAIITHDNLGRVTSASLAGQTVTQGYDALGRKISESTPQGTVHYSYDATGALTQITWPDGFYVNYDRDLTETVTAIRENGATSGVGVLAQYTYDSLGNRLTVGRGNGVATSYAYDGLSRLQSLAHAPANPSYNQTLVFGYNAAGQINAQGTSNSLYAWTGSYTVTRGYTPNGLNQLITSGALNLSYDLKGNLTSDGVNSYGYNTVNQLTNGPNGAALVYDPLGRLTQTSSASTALTQLAYGGDQLLTELDVNGNVLRRYVPGPTGADDPIVWYEGSGTASRRWLLSDQRRSVIAVTDATGAVINGTANTYDDYGVPGGANIGRFQYTGQLWIPELALYHYKARAYSPTLGRFMQTDPIGYASDINLYAYAANDPINGSDPSGKDANFDPHWQMVTAIYGTSAGEDGACSGCSDNDINYISQQMDNTSLNLLKTAMNTDSNSTAGGLNGWGYTDPPGDNFLLARMMFSEAAGYPNAYAAIGWSAVNRIRAPGFASTMSGVIFQTDSNGNYQYGVDTPLWNMAGDPSGLSSGNAKSYNQALNTANGILAGTIPDPTGGATFFYSSNSGMPPRGFFANSVSSGRLNIVYSVGPYYFLKSR